jgi:hypothetical protein
MFSVLFEVQPRPGKWDDYLDNAKMLRPELERINGSSMTFVIRAYSAKDGFSPYRVGETKSPWCDGAQHRTIIPFSRDAAPIFLRTIIYAWVRYLLTIWSLQECICCTSAVARLKSAREQWSRLSRRRALRAIPLM